MKLNKLLVSSALILVLGLGACNTKKPDGPVEPSSSEQESQSESSSESQVDPVSRIKIEAPSTIVVGQPVDLDDYVTIEGGEGPKVFDVQIPATMTELVEVEGHQLTALAEGTINVKIIAGAREAKFETDAMSALKAAFAEATAELSNVWAMDELYEGQLYVGAVHRADYSCFGVWDDDTNAPGGFLKAQNGKTYQYVLDDNFENIEVDSAIQADFDLYYCNSEWLLSPSDFETVTDEEGNESLVMSGDLPGTWGSSSAPNKAAEFAYTLAQALSSKYMFNGIIVTPFTIGEGEDAVETFQFDLPIVKTDARETVLVTYSYVLNLDEEETEIDAVREYIDSGAFPEALTFDEAQDKVSAIATGKIYTSTTTAYWYNPTTQEQIEAPANTGYWLDYFGQYFSVGSEVDYVNASTVYQQVTVGETTAVFGDIAHDGALYTFTNMGESGVGETLNATLVEGSDVWTDKVSDTIGAMNSDALWEGFTPTDKIENKDGSVTIVTDGKNCNLALMTAFLESTYLGHDVNSIGMGLTLTPQGGGDSFPAMEYFDLAITVAADSLTIDVGFTWNSTIAYSFSTQYTGIGTDAVPANISDIVYPQA